MIGPVLSGHRADWTFVPHRVGRATPPFLRTGDFVTGVHPAWALPKRMGKARGLHSCERGFWSRAPGRGGAPVSALRFFVQSRDFLFLPIVQSPHPQNAAPRSFPRGRSFFPYVFKWGGPLGHHRPGIVSCLWNGWEDGAGRSDPELASGRDRVSSPCHTSRVVG